MKKKCKLGLYYKNTNIKENQNLALEKLVRGTEFITPKCATVASALFWAEGKQERSLLLPLPLERM